MSTVAYCKVVVACFEAPCTDGAICLLCSLVIRCHVKRIEFHCNFFGSTRLKNACFSKGNELDRALLKAALGVRSLYIKLYNILACHITGVGDSDLCCSGSAYFNFN